MYAETSDYDLATDREALYMASSTDPTYALGDANDNYGLADDDDDDAEVSPALDAYELAASSPSIITRKAPNAAVGSNEQTYEMATDVCKCYILQVT